MKYSMDEKKIVYADLDPKEGVLLNLNTKNYYRLNETGQKVWQALAQGKNEEEIAKDLSQQFEVEPEVALSDVKTMITKLKNEKLVESSSSNTAAFSVQNAHASKSGKKPLSPK